MAEHDKNDERFLPEQVDEQIKHIEQSTQPEPVSRLMHDLRIVSQDYNEMSDRVWNRLLDHMEHTPARTQQRLNERIHVMSQLQPKPRRRFISWITLVAAIILALFVTGSSIAIFQSAHSQSPNSIIGSSNPVKSTSTNKPVITPTPTVTPLPAGICNLQNDGGWASVCTTKQYTMIDQIHNLKDSGMHIYAGYADSNRIILVFSIQDSKSHPGQWATPQMTLSVQKGVNLSPRATMGASRNLKTMQNYGLYSQPLLSVADNTTMIHLHVDVDLNLQLFASNSEKADVNTNEKTSFDFSIPFHNNSHTININQTQTVNGQPITLDHVSISPTQTLIYIGALQLNTGMSSVNGAEPLISPSYELHIGNWKSLGKTELVNDTWNENDDKHLLPKGIELEINYALLDKTGEWTLIIHHEAIPGATEDVVFNFKI